MTSRPRRSLENRTEVRMLATLSVTAEIFSSVTCDTRDPLALLLPENTDPNCNQQPGPGKGDRLGRARKRGEPESLSEIDSTKKGFTRNGNFLTWLCEQTFPSLRSQSAVSASAMLAGVVARGAPGAIYRRCDGRVGSLRNLCGGRAP